MKHVGDVTKIDARLVEPVNCIIGGSPCQDLSVAGKREGLAGERSGLFMEQVRIAKEMYDAGRSLGRPDIGRWLVWENVAGAFSSSGGDDFRAVLEELARVAEPGVSIPRPKKRWAKAGCICGDGWSIAWRLHDAQYWGVPQRRQRIALVADFRGLSAPKVLFKPESLSRSFRQGREERESPSEGTERSIGVSGATLSGDSGCDGKTISFQERFGKPGGGQRDSDTGR